MTETKKKYLIVIGFNIIVDRKSDPAGKRFEPSSKPITADDLPEGTDIKHLIEMGALKLWKPKRKRVNKLVKEGADE